MENGKLQNKIKKFLRFSLISALFSFFFFLFSFSVSFAFEFVSIRDLIINADPSVLTNHEIRFRLSHAVPPGGKIIITPEDGDFLIPDAFNIDDVDFSFALLGETIFTERDIAVARDATHDGVSIVTGYSGSVTFTLNTTSGFSANDTVQVKFGTNATHGASGVNRLVNPPIDGSYKINIETKDATDAVLDTGNTRIAIILPVTVGPVDTINPEPPAILFAAPTGLLPGGTVGVEMYIETDIPASCRYATTTGVLFEDMTNVFPFIFWSPPYLNYGARVLGLTDSATSTFYIRCDSYQHVENEEDYVLEFRVGSESSDGEDGGGTGGTSGSGTGASSGGGGIPGGGIFLKPAEITLRGFSYPRGRVYVLQDGKELAAVGAAGDGLFTVGIDSLQRGAYTFGMYSTDPSGTRSAIVSSTVFLGSDTKNIVDRILIPPTIKAEIPTINPGDTISLSGFAIPESIVEVFLSDENDFSIKLKSASTTADSSGNWSVELNSGGLSIGQYRTLAFSVLETGDVSDFSLPIPIGVGQEAAPDFASRADLNQDGKVNLVDFSMLLYSWGTNDAVADINLSGKVDLTDFSIMIFYWTG